MNVLNSIRFLNKPAYNFEHLSLPVDNFIIGQLPEISNQRVRGFYEKNLKKTYSVSESNKIKNLCVFLRILISSFYHNKQKSPNKKRKY